MDSTTPLIIETSKTLNNLFVTELSNALGLDKLCITIYFYVFWSFFTEIHSVFRPYGRNTEIDIGDVVELPKK